MLQTTGKNTKRVWRIRGVENRKADIFLHLCYGMLFIYFQQYRWLREVRRD